MFERKAFYSPHEVAEIGGLSTSTILNYIRSGKLYAVRLSERTYRIPLGAVIATFYPQQKAPAVIVRRGGGQRAVDLWLRELRKEHAASRAPRRRTTATSGRPRATRRRAAVRA